MFSSIMLEYMDLYERYDAIETNISTCVEQALQTSVKSEEMFSDLYQQKVASYTVTNANKSAMANKGAANLVVFDRVNGNFFDANAYVYSYLYTKENQPIGMSRMTVDGRKSSWGNNTADRVFEWLYGELGSEYGASSLEWANFNRSVLDDLDGGVGREPNRLFRDFYNAIGNTVTVKGYTKRKQGDTSNSYTTFKVEAHEYPVLAQMGLRLSSYNDTTSIITADNFTSSFHIGRTTSRSTNAVTKTRYYLTPASLGVTYVPAEVFTPVFKANLDTLVRLQKVSQGNKIASEINGVAASATGCIETDVYAGNGTSHVQHDSDGSDIVNDGLNEYDLDSVRVKVEYLPVDIWDESNPITQAIVARSYGLISSAKISSTANYQDSIAKTLEKVKQKDTGKNYATVNGMSGNFVNGNRIAARVTVKMKVHVCYKSSILQWLCRMFTGGGSNHEHYDVKVFGNKDGIGSRTGYSNDYDGDDGTWYEYTTYFMRSR